MHDERIPLEHGVIGQETQGAGGFFMALRAITVLKDVCAEMEELCPDAWIFNYTNPVNIVAEAITHNSPDQGRLALRGADLLPRHRSPTSAGLDPEKLDVDDGRPQPRLLGRRAELRRRATRCRCSPRRGSGAGTTRRSSRGAPAPAPARGRDGRDPGRLLPVLLLHRRGARRVPGEADDARRGHPRAGRATTGATTRSRRGPTTRSSTRPARAAASTSSSSRST